MPSLSLSCETFSFDVDVAKQCGKKTHSLQSLPKYNDLYYITVKALKKYKNGETAMLTRLISQVGSYDLHYVDGKDRCSCKKHGMKCSMARGQCRGSSCSNANAPLEVECDSDSDED